MLEIVLEDEGASRVASSLVCFNPCCVGNSSGRRFSLQSSLSVDSFNPCCVGNSSGSERELDAYYTNLKFQSLLCWK